MQRLLEWAVGVGRGDCVRTRASTCKPTGWQVNEGLKRVVGSTIASPIQCQGGPKTGMRDRSPSALCGRVGCLLVGNHTTSAVVVVVVEKRRDGRERTGGIHRCAVGRKSRLDSLDD